MPATATTTPETEQRRLTLSAVLDRFGIGLALILLMVILAILSPQGAAPPGALPYPLRPKAVLTKQPPPRVTFILLVAAFVVA